MRFTVLCSKFSNRIVSIHSRYITAYVSGKNIVNPKSGAPQSLQLLSNIWLTCNIVICVEMVAGPALLWLRMLAINY